MFLNLAFALLVNAQNPKAYDVGRKHRANEYSLSPRKGQYDYIASALICMYYIYMCVYVHICTYMYIDGCI